jgi:excisionase family DNA binding protein
MVMGTLGTPMRHTAAQPVKLLLTPVEAAEVLGIKRTLLYELIMRRRILSVKVGGARRIPLKALQTYVEELCDGGKVG